MAKSNWFAKFGAMIGVCYLVLGWMGSFLLGVSLLTATLSSQSWLDDYGHGHVYGLYGALLALTILGTFACSSLIVSVDNVYHKPEILKQHRSRLIIGILCVFTLFAYFAYNMIGDSQYFFLGMLIAHSPLLIPAVIAFNYTINSASGDDLAAQPAIA